MGREVTVNSEKTEPDKESSELPEADVEPRGWTIFWIIPILALGVTAWLVYREFVFTGEKIQITFQDASGLQPGKSQLKFRGVDVGRGRKLDVSEDRKRSIVTVSLEKQYKDLAREGTEFWVVRPRVS